MSSENELELFRPIYDDYRSSILEPIEAELKKKVFKEWRAPEYWKDFRRFEESAVPQPLQRTKVRIKRLESVLDKFHRMRGEFPGPPSLENMSRLRDALGGRVIVFFPGQLLMLDQEIRSGRHFELSAEKPPKSYLPRHVMDNIGLDPDNFRGSDKKPSGYASLHYFVRLKEAPAAQNPWFELQTRTMLEEVWGEVEHQVGYKPDTHTDFSVKRQFRVISDHLSALDAHLDFINSELAFHQANAEVEETDLLNAENLPSVLRVLELVVVQGEISGLLRILENYGVTTVGGLHRLGSRLDIIEAIQAEYRRLKPNRTPTAFDVIPVLLQLPEGAPSTDAKRILRLHVEVSEARSGTTIDTA